MQGRRLSRWVPLALIFVAALANACAAPAGADELDVSGRVTASTVAGGHGIEGARSAAHLEEERLTVDHAQPRAAGRRLAYGEVHRREARVDGEVAATVIDDDHSAPAAAPLRERDPPGRRAVL